MKRKGAMIIDKLIALKIPTFLILVVIVSVHSKLHASQINPHDQAEIASILSNPNHSPAYNLMLVRKLYYNPHNILKQKLDAQPQRSDVVQLSLNFNLSKKGIMHRQSLLLAAKLSMNGLTLKKIITERVGHENFIVKNSSNDTINLKQDFSLLGVSYPTPGNRGIEACLNVYEK